MGKHASHKTPTCKRCGSDHYNFHACPAPVDQEMVPVATVNSPRPLRVTRFKRQPAVLLRPTAPADIIHRHDVERRNEWSGLTAGSFAATGDFTPGRFKGAAA